MASEDGMGKVEELADKIGDEISSLMRSAAEVTTAKHRERLLTACMLVNGKPNIESIIDACVRMLQCCGAQQMVDQVCKSWDEERNEAKNGDEG